MGKHKKKSVRLCTTCGYRHSTPTGRNCEFVANNSKDLPAVAGVERNEDPPSSDDEQGAAAALHGQQFREAEFWDEFNARLDRLEGLVLKSFEKKDNDDESEKKATSVEGISDLDSDDSLYSADTEDRHHRKSA